MEFHPIHYLYTVCTVCILKWVRIHKGTGSIRVWRVGCMHICMYVCMNTCFEYRLGILSLAHYCVWFYHIAWEHTVLHFLKGGKNRNKFFLCTYMLNICRLSIHMGHDFPTFSTFNGCGRNQVVHTVRIHWLLSVMVMSWNRVGR